MSQKDGGRKSYESTVMRMAGNIVSGMLRPGEYVGESLDDNRAKRAVRLARAIVAETLRTEPVKEKPTIRVVDTVTGVESTLQVQEPKA